MPTTNNTDQRPAMEMARSIAVACYNRTTYDTDQPDQHYQQAEALLGSWTSQALEAIAEGAPPPKPPAILSMWAEGGDADDCTVVQCYAATPDDWDYATRCAQAEAIATLVEAFACIAKVVALTHHRDGEFTAPRVQVTW